MKVSLLFILTVLLSSFLAFVIAIIFNLKNVPASILNLALCVVSTQILFHVLERRS